MAKKGRSKSPEEDNGAPSKGRSHKSRKRSHEDESELESEPESALDVGSKKSGGSRRNKRSSSSKRHRRSRDDDVSDSESSSDSYSDDPTSETESEASSEDSDERRRRRRKERKRREERDREKKRRRRREKEKEKDKRRKRKEKEKKKRRKDKEGKTGAVTNSWGKYGIIRETDMWNKRPEFTAWLAEVKQVNLESLPNWEEKQLFKEFMEDHNTATFPSKKYYDLDAYFICKMEKENKRGGKKVMVRERTVFNDEEQRRQELLREREKQKEEQVEALKLSMQSGMAQAMKEQALLREEMALQYKLGNFEAAAAIQRRLDPDAPV